MGRVWGSAVAFAYDLYIHAKNGHHHLRLYYALAGEFVGGSVPAERSN